MLNSLLFVYNFLFYHPVVNLILFIYKYLGNNLGISIVLLTIIIRLILWPLVDKQIKSAKKMQDLKPQLDKLKKKYSKDKQKFQEEQLKLFKENGVNPAGSCLGLLIQLPFIWSVYNVINTISHSSNAAVFNSSVYFNTLKFSSSQHFNMDFLGFNLAKSANSIGYKSFSVVFIYILLALLVGLAQYFASRVSLPIEKNELEESADIIDVKSKKTSNNDSPLDPEAFSKTLSTQMLYVFPVLLVWISLGYPAGLSIYWIVQALFSIIQTLIIQEKFIWKKK